MQAAPAAAGANFTLPVPLLGLENWTAMVGQWCETVPSAEEGNKRANDYIQALDTIKNTLVRKFKFLPIACTSESLRCST